MTRSSHLCWHCIIKTAKGIFKSLMKNENLHLTFEPSTGKILPWWRTDECDAEIPLLSKIKNLSKLDNLIKYKTTNECRWQCRISSRYSNSWKLFYIKKALSLPYWILLTRTKIHKNVLYKQLKSNGIWFTGVD